MSISYVRQNLKQILFYASWGLLLVFAFFRYGLWRILDQKYCSENNLLTLVWALLKPNNWLLIAILALTVVALIRVYAWADNRWLWFSHYGGMAVAAALFVALFLISWSCG